MNKTCEKSKLFGVFIFTVIIAEQTPLFLMLCDDNNKIQPKKCELFVSMQTAGLCSSFGWSMSTSGNESSKCY